LDAAGMLLQPDAMGNGTITLIEPYDLSPCPRAARQLGFKISIIGSEHAD